MTVKELNHRLYLFLTSTSD